MHSQEWNERTQCLDCRVMISPDADRSFAVSDETVLCFDCAVKRGGVYDAVLDRWAVPPDVYDLPDERRPHV